MGSDPARAITIQEGTAGYPVSMLYLASQSPRRAELLARLGPAFEPLALDVPEIRSPDETAQAYVRRVSAEKARAGWDKVRHRPGAVVLSADTEVILDGDVFGKPADAADAAAMLRRLSGRTHEVLSVVTAAMEGRQTQVESRSDVTFAPLDEADIAAYVASGEPMGKAGAYAIQGPGERFVAHLSGSHSGVMGLPMHETWTLLREFGVL